MKRLVVLALLGSSQPAFAQQIDANMKMSMPMPAKPAAKPKPKPKAAPAPAKKQPAPVQKLPAKSVLKPQAPAPMPMDHSQMDHDNMAGVPIEEEASTLDQMDHDRTGHDTMGHDPMNMPEDGMQGMDRTMTMTMTIPMADEPPPPAAGSGPANAADSIWGAVAMDAARRQLASENGGQTLFWIMADRAEYSVREGKNGYLWDGQGYYGGDINKFWFKTEGEGSFGQKIESAETQALYSRAIAPFFDLQVGIRQDFAPRDRTYAVVGVQGLAPYLFEIDAAAFLSDKGDLTARIEAEYDQRITQRLILQPRLELNLAAQDVPELRIGAGLDTIETGLRLRYQFAREFAPYVGIAQEWKVGQSADYAHADGEDSSVTNYVVGVRFWF